MAHSKRGSVVFFLFLIITLLSGCVKEEYDIDKISKKIENEWKFLGPLLKGNLTIKNALEPSDTIQFYGENNDSVMLVIKPDTFATFQPPDIFTIPEQEINAYNIVSPISVPEFLLPPVYTELDTIELYEFIFNDNERLDSIIFSQGQIVIDVASTFQHEGVLIVKSPGVLIGGEQLLDTIPISSSGGSYTGSEIIDLTGETVVFADSLEETNAIAVVFELILTKTPGQGIDAGDKASILFNFTNLEYTELYGYIGQKEFNIEKDSIEVFLDNFDFLSGTFTPADPRLRIGYTNSFGVPMGGSISLGGKFESGRIVPDDSASISIEAPLEPGSAVEGEILIDRNLITNMNDLITFPAPRFVYTSGRAISNPDGDITRNNFITRNSQLDVEVEIEIPLHFAADLTITDTMNFDPDNIEELESIEYANLHVKMKNEFPVGINANLLLYDSTTFTILDTLEVDFLRAAPVDKNDLVILENVNEVKTVIAMDKDMIDNFFNRMNKIIVIGHLETFKQDGTPRMVKILTSYNLDFSLALDAKATISTNLD
ncbi:MAG: hypothetical protein ACOCXD_00235 [Bacteroidota bacterium]